MVIAHTPRPAPAGRGRGPLRSNGRVRGARTLAGRVWKMTCRALHRNLTQCVAPIDGLFRLRESFAAKPQMPNRSFGPSSAIASLAISNSSARSRSATMLPILPAGRRLVIEIEGATHSSDDELRRDAIRTAFLERVGYRVIRFQNEDVYNAMDGVLGSILTALEEKGYLPVGATPRSRLPWRGRRVCVGADRESPCANGSTAG